MVQGNGFLYNMVRTMAGTLLAGKGRMTPDEVSAALEARDRSRRTDRPRAVSLSCVLYDEPTFSARAADPLAEALGNPARSTRSGLRTSDADPERNSSGRAWNQRCARRGLLSVLALTAAPCSRV